MPIEDKDIHKGHRSRMRAKLASYGPRIFDTYELLEMLLYYVIPYKDTNPISKRLLDSFGSLDGVLRAPVDELVKIDGIGEKCASFINNVGTIMIENDAMSFGCHVDIFDDYNFAGSYLANYFSKSESRICIALLDNGMRLIGIKDIPGKDFSSGAVKPKYFIDAALTSGATVAIIAHVHEHGALYPTEGDMATDKLIRSELAKVGVLVAEHYIIGGPHYIGLKLGLSIRVSGVIPGLDKFYESIPVMASTSDMTVNAASGDNSGYYCYAGENPLEKLLAISVGEHKAYVATRSLLSRYGRFSTVLSENEDEICRAASIGMSTALLIKLAGYVNSRRVTDLFEFGKKYDTMELLDYVKALFMGVSVETVYLVSFDDKKRLVGCDHMGEGTVGAADIYPRKLLEAAIKRKASTVILAHNHPKGTTSPSNDDFTSTRRLSSLFYGAGVRLDAHYIVADGEIGRVDEEFIF